MSKLPSEKPLLTGNLDTTSKKFSNTHRSPVGADVSRPPPIYRPSVTFTISLLICPFPISASISINPSNLLFVILSAAKDLTPRASILRSAQRDSTLPYCRALAKQGCFYLSSRLPPLVILSEAKDLTSWVEMLRSAQHDNILPDHHAASDTYYRRMPIKQLKNLTSSKIELLCLKIPLKMSGM